MIYGSSEWKLGQSFRYAPATSVDFLISYACSRQFLRLRSLLIIKEQFLLIINYLVGIYCSRKSFAICYTLGGDTYFQKIYKYSIIKLWLLNTEILYTIIFLNN